MAGLGNRAVGLAEVCAEVGVGVAFPDDAVVILCVGVIQDLPQGLFRARPVGARFFWPQILQPIQGPCSNRFSGGQCLGLRFNALNGSMSPCLEYIQRLTSWTCMQHAQPAGLLCMLGLLWLESIRLLLHGLPTQIWSWQVKLGLLTPAWVGVLTPAWVWGANRCLGWGANPCLGWGC